MTVERAGTDGIAMRTVDLGFVTVGKASLFRRAKIHPGIAFVVDLDLGPEAEVLVISAAG